MGRLALIAALGPDRVIGQGGALPWRLPADLARFKARTLGRPVIMGRLTHASIGRALPGRPNLVVSSSGAPLAPGVTRCAGLEEALAACAEAEEALIIGGAGLYRAGLARADRLYLTLVHGAFAGDRFFPPLAPGAWRVVARAWYPADARNAFAQTEYVLERGLGPWPAALAGWLEPGRS